MQRITHFEIVVNDCYSWIKSCYRITGKSTTKHASQVYYFDNDVFFHSTHVNYNRWKNIIGIPVSHREYLSETPYLNTLNTVVSTIPKELNYSITVPQAINTMNAEKFIAKLLSLDSRRERIDTCPMILPVSPEMSNVQFPSLISRIDKVDTSDLMIEYYHVNKDAYRDSCNQEEIDFYSQIDLQDNQINRFLAYDENGKSIACAALFYNYSTSSAFLFDISVRQHMQGNGLGTFMTKYLISQASKQNMEYCTLTAISKDIYLKIGFQDLGTVSYVTTM
jgi:GNAT superfamily N-acetyltransferase